MIACEDLQYAANLKGGLVVVHGSSCCQTLQCMQRMVLPAVGCMIPTVISIVLHIPQALLQLPFGLTFSRCCGIDTAWLLIAVSRESLLLHEQLLQCSRPFSAMSKRGSQMDEALSHDTCPQLGLLLCKGLPL